MAKRAIFSWIFYLFLSFFIDCGHIYVPKGAFRGSTSRPHIGDLVMSLFLLWPFRTLSGPSEPFWTISSKNWFFGPKHLRQPYFVQLGHKFIFCLKWSQVSYSYLAPKFHENQMENQMLGSTKTNFPSLLWPAEWKVLGPLLFINGLEKLIPGSVFVLN